jgi:hypothetical protein
LQLLQLGSASTSLAILLRDESVADGNSTGARSSRRAIQGENGRLVRATEESQLGNLAVLWYNVDAIQPGDEKVSTGEAGLGLQAEEPGPR